MISGKSLLGLAAKRRVEVGRGAILSASFWNSASKFKLSMVWSGKRIIKAFGKAAGNCSEKDLSIVLFSERDLSIALFFERNSSGVLASASGFAVILIPFSVR